MVRKLLISICCILLLTACEMIESGCRRYSNIRFGDVDSVAARQKICFGKPYTSVSSNGNTIGLTFYADGLATRYLCCDTCSYKITSWNVDNIGVYNIHEDTIYVNLYWVIPHAFGFTFIRDMNQLKCTIINQDSIMPRVYRKPRDKDLMVEYEVSFLVRADKGAYTECEMPKWLRREFNKMRKIKYLRPKPNHKKAKRFMW